MHFLHPVLVTWTEEMIQSMFNTRQEAQRQLGSEVRCKAVHDSKGGNNAVTEKKGRRELNFMGLSSKVKTNALDVSEVGSKVKTELKGVGGGGNNLTLRELGL
jgi:hypothetical protein